nr:hypothetical protein 49p1_00223 [Yersinia frederiksenii]
MLYILVIAIIPLLVILCLYLNNPESPTLNAIATGTSGLPAVLSTKNPLLSKVMDVYCKTAPLFAFILFLISRNNLKLKNEKDFFYALRTLFLFTAFYIIFIYSYFLILN